MTAFGPLRRRIILAVVALAIAGAVAAGVFIQNNKRAVALNVMKLMRVWAPPPSPVADDSRLQSALHDIAIANIPAPVDSGQGGAIEAHDGGVFMVTRLGAFQRLDADGQAFVPMALAPPEPVVTGGRFYNRDKDFAGLGYRDLILRDAGAEGVEVTISKSRLRPDRDCVNLAVWQAVIDRDALLDGTGEIAADWRDVWESSPCLTDAENTFPYQAGGDMVFTPAGEIAIFVGDFGIDTFNRTIEGIGPQHDGNDYGKVVAIDPATGDSRIVSKGHRNPGGLDVDAEGRLWAAEHGPEGGDEINLIREGGNYGWPRQSLGTHYGAATWPPDPVTGRHEAFTKPVYAFVPSVATSSIAFYDGAAFPNWQGDLLLATFKERPLYRLHIREGRVIVAEPMPLEIRIRDLTVDAEGRIWIKDDTTPSVLRLSPAARPAPEPRHDLSRGGLKTGAIVRHWATAAGIGPSGAAPRSPPVRTVSARAGTGPAPSRRTAPPPASGGPSANRIPCRHAFRAAGT